MSAVSRSTDIGDLGLTARTVNVLRAERIKTVGDLMALGSEKALILLPNMGRKSAHEAQKTLASHGYDIYWRDRQPIIGPKSIPRGDGTLRDEFAMQAMHALISEPPWDGESRSLASLWSDGSGTNPGTPDRYAFAAYAMADAMLKARSK